MMWTYKARLEKESDVYDGDSFKVTIDLGLRVYHRVRIRLYGINTPEIKTKDKKEREAGIKARDWLRNRLKGKEFILRIRGKEKYGRWLADLYIGKRNIVKEMLKLGLGVEYYGGKRGQCKEKRK
ncbi:MAG: thermonuclease family protein [Thermoprotei archaeon]|nr:MAG: thermonuclease family protein [Thermoprotei archaeon]